MQPPTKTHLYRQYLRFSLGCLLIGFGLPIGVDALGLPDWLFVLAVCGSFVLAVLLTIETWIRLRALGLWRPLALLIPFAPRIGSPFYAAKHLSYSIALDLGVLILLVPIVLCWLWPLRQQDAIVAR